MVSSRSSLPFAGLVNAKHNQSRRRVGTVNLAEMDAETVRIWTTKLGYQDENAPLNCEFRRSPRLSSGGCFDAQATASFDQRVAAFGTIAAVMPPAVLMASWFQSASFSSRR